MVPIEYRTYIPRGYGLIGFIIISFLYEELAARARENHATTEYLQARYGFRYPPTLSLFECSSPLMENRRSNAR